MEDWTLGPAQMRWLERTLLSSDARWKLVVGHHLVGGWDWDLTGRTRNTPDKYGRGGARYAMEGEQSHDVHFVCCGRCTRHTVFDVDCWGRPGWKEAYGDHGARDPHDFYAAIGFVRLEVSANGVAVQYIRSLVEPKDNVTTPIGGVVYEVLL